MPVISPAASIHPGRAPAWRAQWVWAPTTRFLVDNRGFAAVEFALVLPLLLLFAFGVSEVGRFVLLGLKVQHAADTVADLASGSSQLTGARLTDLFDAAKHVVAPFDAATRGVVIVSGVTLVGNGPAAILWQRKGGGSLTASSALGVEGGNPALPPGLVLRDGEDVIVAEMYYRYDASLLGLIPAGTLRRVAYYRPRFALPASL